MAQQGLNDSKGKHLRCFPAPGGFAAQLVEGWPGGSGGHQESTPRSWDHHRVVAVWAMAGARLSPLRAQQLCHSLPGPAGDRPAGGSPAAGPRGGGKAQNVEQWEASHLLRVGPGNEEHVAHADPGGPAVRIAVWRRKSSTASDVCVGGEDRAQVAGFGQIPSTANGRALAQTASWVGRRAAHGAENATVRWKPSRARTSKEAVSGMWGSAAQQRCALSATCWVPRWKETGTQPASRARPMTRVAFRDEEGRWTVGPGYSAGWCPGRHPAPGLRSRAVP